MSSFYSIKSWLLIVSLIYFCGCAVAEEKFYSMDAIPAEIDAPVDTEFRCFVEENVTTGFRWEAQYDQSKCEVIINHLPSESDLCGAPGKAEVIIRANDEGPVAVVFLYRRSFEQGVPAARQFVVNLKR